MQFNFSEILQNDDYPQVANINFQTKETPRIGPPRDFSFTKSNEIEQILNMRPKVKKKKKKKPKQIKLKLYEEMEITAL